MVGIGKMWVDPRKDGYPNDSRDVLVQVWRETEPDRVLVGKYMAKYELFILGEGHCEQEQVVAWAEMPDLMMRPADWSPAWGG